MTRVKDVGVVVFLVFADHVTVQRIHIAVAGKKTETAIVAKPNS